MRLRIHSVDEARSVGPVIDAVVLGAGGTGAIDDLEIAVPSRPTGSTTKALPRDRTRARVECEGDLLPAQHRADNRRPLTQSLY